MGDINENKNEKMTKSDAIVKSVPNELSQDFIPPDGGWGWIVVFSAGLSQFCLMAVQQSFGLLFRDRFQQLGITSSEVTIILNVNLAMISFIGLANGAMFRKFTFRKIAFFGSLMTGMSLAFLSCMTSFYGIFLCLSIFYSAGLGITLSANSLALNTYFKKKRRIAIGLSWTCTGLGPIIMPQIITILLPIYGVPGTILLFSGIALNAVACSLLLQPVAWHAKNISLVDEIMAEAIKDELGVLTNEKQKDTNQNSEDNVMKGKFREVCELNENRMSRLYSSQYFYDDDNDEGTFGVDVISAPTTAMMSRANDGWFSQQYISSASLGSYKISKRNDSQNSKIHQISSNLTKAPSFPILSKLNHGDGIYRIDKLYHKNDGRKKNISKQQNVPLLIKNEDLNDPVYVNDEKVKDDEWKDLSKTDEYPLKKKQSRSLISRFITAVIIFFDLTLLRDYVYTNLMLGINFANFTEMNFAMLTPFILAEYGLQKIQVATVMSVLGGMDVIGRFAISFIASKFAWNNRTFFLIGIGCMAFGRIILAHIRSFEVIIAVGVLIGFGKALRTIFMALVIPSHVPLSRLPAATGLQLVTSGIISIGLGPLVGWIRDICGSYSIVLHILNILTFLTMISWILEMYITSRREKHRPQTLIYS